MIEGGAGTIILRQGGQGGLPGSVPLPQEGPLLGEQERFEALLKPEESATLQTDASARITEPGPAQENFFRPSEIAASSGHATEKTRSVDTLARSFQVSGDTILEGLLGMGDPFSPGFMPVSGVGAPEELLAVRSSLAQGGTAIEMMNKVQSRMDEGIEQLTKG